MKKKKLFKNRVQMITYFIIFGICIYLFIAIGNIDFHKDDEPDALKFSDIYKNVPTDNVFKIVNASYVRNTLDGRSGIILMGFPSNKWTSYYAEIVNDVAKDTGINEILYYDFLKDRKNSNGTYEQIIEKYLNNYIKVNDEGIKNIMAPSLVVVKNGEILSYFDDTTMMNSNITPEEYYSSYQMKITYENFKIALQNYKG